jgi:hypothetical protein
MSDAPGPLRYAIKGTAGVSYTVEGLESLAFLGRITPDTEVAELPSDHYFRLREADFFPAVFPARKPLALRQRPEVFRPPPAPVEGHVGDSVSLAELRARIARDPNDITVHLLAIRLRSEMHREGLTAAEVFNRFFERNFAAQSPEPVSEGLMQRLLSMLR